MISQINKGGGSAPPFFNDAIRSSSYIGGKYYPPSVNFDSFDTQRLVPDTVQYLPFVPIETYTFVGITVSNTDTGDSGDNIRLGIYADNGDATPGYSVLRDGLVTLDASIANRTASISQELTRGVLYWLAVLSNGNPELLCFANNSNPGGSSLFASTWGLSGNSLGSTLRSSVPVGYLQSRSYANGLPLAATIDTTVTVANSAATMICLKA